jgi:GT2 family glycosyltransferase
VKKIVHVSSSVAKKAFKSPKQLIKMSKTAAGLLRGGELGEVKKRIRAISTGAYHEWYLTHYTLLEDDRTQIRRRIEKMAHRPLISILMPVYDTPDQLLREAIDSVRHQLYPNWELCIADDCSPREATRTILREYESMDARIRVVYRKENGRIAQASNSALELVKGEFTALFDHDDVLTENALYMIAEEINQYPKVDLIYSDEDKLSEHGFYYDPYFKPDWNSDLFYCQNFINHLSVFKSATLKRIGGFRSEYEGSQDYDMMLRFIEASSEKNIRHIPYILYHWRAVAGSVALAPSEKNYAHENARKAIRDHFARRKADAKVVEGNGAYHRVVYPIQGRPPKVTAVVCTRDRVDLLEVIVQGLLSETDYDYLELLIVDNDSALDETAVYLHKLKNTDARVKVIPFPGPFNFAAMNNEAVRHASGEFIAFLNNDLQVIHPDWLKEMVSHALQPGVGAVGAKLYYGNDTIQHGGVILGVGGIAGHAFKHFPKANLGLSGGRLGVQQTLSAVTGACMLVRKRDFLAVGGFDEKNLAVAFNDIDLCLRLGENGKRIVYTPFAELYHLESISRGPDATDRTLFRFMGEANYMWNRWKDVILNDPFYNPNLSVTREDFTLSTHPRIPKPWLSEKL